MPRSKFPSRQPHLYNHLGSQFNLKNLDSNYRVIAAVSWFGLKESILKICKGNSLALVLFNTAIWKYFDLYLQDVETYMAKMRVREELLDLIRKVGLHLELVYPTGSLFVVGSSINGCGTNDSDMDLCLNLPHYHTKCSGFRRSSLEALDSLMAFILKNKPDFIIDCELIPASVPILRLVLSVSFGLLKVDLNVNNISGIYNSHLLHYYSSIDSRFPALCVLVKRWATWEGIKDPAVGTFNRSLPFSHSLRITHILFEVHSTETNGLLVYSYTLNLMVVHFLQCGIVPPVLPNLQKLMPQRFSLQRELSSLELFDESIKLPEWEMNKCSVGELLIAFFDYYCEFDFRNDGISIRKGSTFSRSVYQAFQILFPSSRSSESRLLYQSQYLPLRTKCYQIYVEDPFDCKNTARAIQNIEDFGRIKLAFLNAREKFLGKQDFDLCDILR
ncbi:unnamed protein product [Enterobius vermicularis]|uniref:PAP-associated domain-containing protein n=1 Tax=Enterobius vermicularis TaxID=51028 RepID=A0A0N4V992_ENTVE|nr:unnamed protein product [Enterobius vermicularis]